MCYVPTHAIQLEVGCSEDKNFVQRKDRTHNVDTQMREWVFLNLQTREKRLFTCYVTMLSFWSTKAKMDTLRMRSIKSTNKQTSDYFQVPLLSHNSSKVAGVLGKQQLGFIVIFPLKRK